MTKLPLLPLIFGATCALAQSGHPAYERILLPLDTEGRSGAAGSRWVTDFIVRNEGEVPVAMFHALCNQTCECTEIITQCFPDPPLEPGKGRKNWVINEQHPTVMFWVERARADVLSFALRLYETSRGNADFGTEIPVLRESDVFRGPLWLAGVPVSSESRTHLRVYGISSPSGEGFVRIRIYPGEASAPSFDEIVKIPPGFVEGTRGPESPLRIPPPNNANGREPGYLEWLIPFAAAAGESTVRVRIDPVTPDLEYWSMASVTSNLTNRVTLVTPQ